jgi:dTDP-4-dehydrorhamnose 3,5-epimerase-like enzyme
VSGDVETCRLVKLPRLSDGRGSLSFVQPGPLLPFEIRRVYYLYDVPSNQTRGAHGHRRLQQLMVAVSGSLTVECDDGRARREFHLDAPDVGLYVTPMIWRNLTAFTEGTVCMVIASEPYDEGDYFRDYNDFLAAATA